MNRLCLLLLGFFVSPMSFAQESTLLIPRSADEMRKFMDEGDARCPGCGVVTNVRQVDGRGPGGNSEREAPVYTTGDAGPGVDVETVTLAGTGSQSRKARREAAQPAPRPWLVTVRYDSGSYAAFEQDDAPAVRKGDRIQVVSGRVERR